MRKIDVYYGDVFAGRLVELDRGSYDFIYDDAFLSDKSTPPVSVNLPKSHKVYHSNLFFLYLLICYQKEQIVGHYAG